MKKNILLLLAVFLALGATSAFAAVNSPFEIMKSVGVDQAKENLVPTLVIWIFILSAVTAGLMKQMMPLVIGGIACFVIAIAPDLATSFTNFDFKTLTDGTTLSVQ